MKIGVRTPSLKKSLKARTTGRLKRQMKKAVNPLYGKKGMGLINNPKKAVYNKVYNKVTVDPLKGVKKQLKSSPSRPNYSAQTQTGTPTSQARIVKTVTYKCNKWIYILLAVFLGFFGAQYFYSGQKRKGVFALLFCLTCIPMLIGFYQAIVALFKKADAQGDITLKVRERANKYQFISESNRVQKLLSEVEQLEPVLKNTLEPEEYVDTVRKITNNLNEVTDFSKAYADNSGFNSLSMLGGLKKMIQGLDDEELDFINRYYNVHPDQEGKAELMKYLDGFSSNAKNLVEKLYK
jgi:TM2 domain-containing membrane protein YozV